MNFELIKKEAESFAKKHDLPYYLLAEFAQHCVEKSNGWRPIATVPKETEVLIGAFIDGKFKWGRSELFYEQANEFEGETFSGWVWSIDYVSDSVAESPTHWQPLPLPPAPDVIEQEPINFDNCRSERMCRRWCGNSACLNTAAQEAA